MSVGVKRPEGVQPAAEMRRELSDSEFVTSPTELALPTSEKNAAQPGSMMHDIQELKNDGILYTRYPSVNTAHVTDDWSYVQVKNGQAAVNIDLKLKDIPAYTSCLIAQVDVLPYATVNVAAVSPGQTGGFLSISDKGEVRFHTEHGLETGIIRGQLVYFYRDNG